MRAIGCPVTVLVLLLFAIQGAAQGQTMRFGIGGYVIQPRLGVAHAELTELMTGTWGGGAARIALGPLALRGSLAAGPLRSADTTTAVAREGAEANAEAELWVAGGLALIGGLRTRGYTSTVGKQVWRILRTGIRLHGPLGTERVRAWLTASYMPSVTVTKRGKPRMAFETDIGLAVAPPRVPVELALGYRFERFDFGQADGSRVEELASFYVGIAYGRVW